MTRPVRIALLGASAAAMIAGLWGGLAYVVRPDLLLFTLLYPAVLFVFADTAERRHGAARSGVARRAPAR